MRGLSFRAVLALKASGPLVIPGVETVEKVFKAEKYLKKAILINGIFMENRRLQFKYEGRYFLRN